MSELATITAHEPPYWDDRAWDPNHAPRGERRLFRALATGDPAKVEDALAVLAQRRPELQKTYGKTRAFALDFPATVAANYPDMFADVEPDEAETAQDTAKTTVVSALQPVPVVEYQTWGPTPQNDAQRRWWQRWGSDR